MGASKNSANGDLSGSAFTSVEAECAAQRAAFVPPQAVFHVRRQPRFHTPKGRISSTGKPVDFIKRPVSE